MSAMESVEWEAEVENGGRVGERTATVNRSHDTPHWKGTSEQRLKGVMLEHIFW